MCFAFPQSISEWDTPIELVSVSDDADHLCSIPAHSLGSGMSMTTSVLAEYFPPPSYNSSLMCGFSGVIQPHWIIHDLQASAALSPSEEVDDSASSFAISTYYNPYNSLSSVLPFNMFTHEGLISCGGDQMTLSFDGMRSEFLKWEINLDSSTYGSNLIAGALCDATLTTVGSDGAIEATISDLLEEGFMLSDVGKTISFAVSSCFIVSIESSSKAQCILGENNLKTSTDSTTVDTWELFDGGILSPIVGTDISVTLSDSTLTIEGVFEGLCLDHGEIYLFIAGTGSLADSTGFSGTANITSSFMFLVTGENSAYVGSGSQLSGWCQRVIRWL
ncbi:hypothetical protein ADUPG1_010065 [Aduncisulcus paluster]|uniref:Uncharacterized protein n=1 Tax=Aduncisulcus paluster TaxID=2918883 RepID=A0ABQ5KXR9_9EUKA|nr:hypothetical protein ADUPG1_010065 [Aduncisulcus paluster]